MTYYSDKYNFAVEFYKGQWIMVCRQKDSIKATPEAEKAIEAWAESNRQKYRKLNG